MKRSRGKNIKCWKVHFYSSLTNLDALEIGVWGQMSEEILPYPNVFSSATKQDQLSAITLNMVEKRSATSVVCGLVLALNYRSYKLQKFMQERVLLAQNAKLGLMDLFMLFMITEISKKRKASLSLTKSNPLDHVSSYVQIQPDAQLLTSTKSTRTATSSKRSGTVNLFWWIIPKTQLLWSLSSRELTLWSYQRKKDLRKWQKSSSSSVMTWKQQMQQSVEIGKSSSTTLIRRSVLWSIARWSQAHVAVSILETILQWIIQKVIKSKHKMGWLMVTPRKHASSAPMVIKQYLRGYKYHKAPMSRWRFLSNQVVMTTLLFSRVLQQWPGSNLMIMRRAIRVLFFQLKR